MTTLQSTLLLVDDTPDNLLYLSDLFTDAGYHILCAESGEMAIDCARHGRPDLIVLDVRMPRMDGFETCRRLKSLVETETIPVVFMSAQVTPETWQEGLAAGGVDFLTKPFCYEEAVTRVMLHLQLQRLQRELAQGSLHLTDTPVPQTMKTSLKVSSPLHSVKPPFFHKTSNRLPHFK